MTIRLDISIGPVQGFVAQSRRTRDLWGSSYLLSFLSAHAMHGAVAAGGRIVQPVVDEDPLYRWVAGCREGESPRIGTLPNHFVVKIDGNGKGVAETAKNSLSCAWKQVTDAVWEKFVAPASALGNDTEGIWNRQVDAFWGVHVDGWPNGPRGEAARPPQALAHPPAAPTNPATSARSCQTCRSYPGTFGGKTAKARRAKIAFGTVLRENLGPLDMRDNERLCATALVKRLFPKVATKALDWEVDTAHWLSTVLRRLYTLDTSGGFHRSPNRQRDYADTVRRGAQDYVVPVKRPPFGLDVPAAGGLPEARCELSAP